MCVRLCVCVRLGTPNILVRIHSALRTSTASDPTRLARARRLGGGRQPVGATAARHREALRDA